VDEIVFIRPVPSKGTSPDGSHFGVGSMKELVNGVLD
jgi:hypothetical protein